MTVVMPIMIVATTLEFLGMGGNGAMMSLATAIVLPFIILWVVGGILSRQSTPFLREMRQDKIREPSQGYR
ncbi:MAG: hypothetical protein ABF379_10340 [Akkermansiaceae bacterium]